MFLTTEPSLVKSILKLQALSGQFAILYSSCGRFLPWTALVAVIREHSAVMPLTLTVFVHSEVVSSLLVSSTLNEYSSPTWPSYGLSSQLNSATSPDVNSHVPLEGSYTHSCLPVKILLVSVTSILSVWLLFFIFAVIFHLLLTASYVAPHSSIPTAFGHSLVTLLTSTDDSPNVFTNTPTTFSTLKPSLLERSSGEISNLTPVPACCVWYGWLYIGLEP